MQNLDPKSSFEIHAEVDKLLRGACMHNLDPKSGANCGFCHVYIFPGVDTRRFRPSAGRGFCGIRPIETRLLSGGSPGGRPVMTL